MNTVTPVQIDVPLIQAMQQDIREIKKTLSHQKPILCLNEAAHFTGFSKSHIYKLSSKGGIPCYKRGKHLLFKREELEQWMLSNRKATVEEIEAEATRRVMFGKGGARKVQTQNKE